MFKYYTSTDYRKTYSIINNINLLSSSNKAIKYSQICQTFIGKGQVQHYFLTSLDIMQNQKKNSDKNIKFIIFVHIAFQNIKKINSINKINYFLSQILKTTNQTIQKQTLKNSPHNTTDSLMNSQKSPFNTSTIKSACRSPSDKLSKQLFLSLNIIKPYLTYLFKLLSLEQLYNQCRSVKKQITFNQGWTVINILKLIQAVIKNFSHIGRYYFKQYESYAILMTECFCRDVLRLYPKIKKLLGDSVSVIEYNFSNICLEFGKFKGYNQLNNGYIDETAQMLEQVSILNESFFQLFMNKYFSQKIEHIQPPSWIQTTQKDYDLVYHLSKIKNNNLKEIEQQNYNKEKNKLMKNLRISPTKIKQTFGSSFSTSFIKKYSMDSYRNTNKIKQIKQLLQKPTI